MITSCRANCSTQCLQASVDILVAPFGSWTSQLAVPDASKDHKTHNTPATLPLWLIPSTFALLPPLTRTFPVLPIFIPATVDPTADAFINPYEVVVTDTPWRTKPCPTTFAVVVVFAADEFGLTLSVRIVAADTMLDVYFSGAHLDVVVLGWW